MAILSVFFPIFDHSAGVKGMRRRYEREEEAEEMIGVRKRSRNEKDDGV